MQRYAGVSCNLDQNLLSACLPLFQEEKVEAIEWSFDALYQIADIPEWFFQFLQTYAASRRLVGHGIYYSMFSGRFTNDQHQWLAKLRRISRDFSFDHVTEHFGFMTGKNFHQGAPIGIPFTPRTLLIGQDRLKRLHEACECAVGVENLAYAASPYEAGHHGHFLEKLVEPVNGFIILDLHNVYCQASNFNRDPKDLLKLYPLHCVREIHISGGSWQPSEEVPGKNIRRDTHDDAVPCEVFDLLSEAIPLCASLKYVMLEQLGSGLTGGGEQEQFRKDFQRMNDIVHATPVNHSPENDFLPAGDIMTGEPVEDEILYRQQRMLSEVLENSASVKEATEKLSEHLGDSIWQVEKWEPQMLETAMAIAKKWKRGFEKQD